MSVLSVMLARGKLLGKSTARVTKRKVFVSFLCIVGGISIFLTSSLNVSAQSEHSQLDYQDGIPEEIREICESVGNDFCICPELLESMAYQESRFIPTAKNGKCYGIMQVNVKVHEDRIEKYGWTADDMFDPEKNIIVAADLLAELYETYSDENPIVLALYNGDWKAVSRYKEYGFMSDYVEETLTRSAEYERLHRK